MNYQDIINVILRHDHQGAINDLKAKLSGNDDNVEKKSSPCMESDENILKAIDSLKSAMNCSNEADMAKSEMEAVTTIHIMCCSIEAGDE